MNKELEFKKIKRLLLFETIIKIIAFSIIVSVIIYLLIDILFNDDIANYVSSLNRGFYLFLVEHKTIVLLLIFFIIFIVISFIETLSLTNKFILVLKAINEISLNPDKEIVIDPSIYYIENKLNEFRLDLVKSRDKAIDEEKKRNDLIMYMAHDIKTPLTSTIGYLTLLKEEDISKKMQDKYIGIALDKALRVEELTNEFFDITKYNLHEMEIVKSKIDLVMLMSQLCEEFYPMLSTKNLKVNLESPSHLDYYGDGNKLARVFDNLIKNAINYSYQDTEIKIIIEESEKEVFIIFRNKGDKIPKYKLEKIFDQFYRVDEARKSTSGGSGLGLAISKDIIMLHGGNISVKNDNEDIEFLINLPK